MNKCSQCKFLQTFVSAVLCFRAVESNRTEEQNSLKMNTGLNSQIKLHGFLLWSSVGFLMPIGIIIMRMSNRVVCSRKLKLIFYSHVIFQILAALFATAGAVLSIRNFDNTFRNSHQRIGLALYLLIWIQPLIGAIRPHRGVRMRSVWFFAHWLLGTGITLTGIVNTYIGLHNYSVRTSKSVMPWTVLFTIEISVLAFIYLLEDKWDYMKKQGVILGVELTTPTIVDKLASPANHKESISVP